jgi:hypothetical protein
MQNLWTADPTLAAASRWWASSGQAKGRELNARELTILLALGIVAALATGAGNLGISLPGHAILRGTLPLVLGVSLVPRRGSGTMMSMAAIITLAAMRVSGTGHLSSAAAVGLACLGPALDVAFAKARPGWRIYTLAAFAGAVANLIAFAVRFGSAAWFGEAGAGRGFMSFWPVALASFVLFGALAGMVSGIAWFRSNPTRDDG